MTKFVFVTGGVASSLGKGLTASSLGNLLTARGLTVGETFFLAFSPERVDPGNKRWTIANTPKVVGGADAASTERAAALYRRVVEKVVPVSSARAAEMAGVRVVQATMNRDAMREIGRASCRERV